MLAACIQGPKLIAHDLDVCLGAKGQMFGRLVSICSAKVSIASWVTSRRTISGLWLYLGSVHSMNWLELLLLLLLLWSLLLFLFLWLW